MKRAKIRRSFSMLELIIVIVIISILTAIATISYSNVLRRTQYKDAMNVCKIIIAAEGSYYIDNGKLTTNLNELKTGGPLGGALVSGGAYYAWPLYGNRIGFGLGFDPNNPANFSKHKFGADIAIIDNQAKVVLYWWREDLPGQIGGGGLHITDSKWSDIK